MTATMASTEHRSAETTIRLSFARILRSEWIKLFSLRSTIWSYLMLFFLSVGFSALTAANSTSTGSAAGRETTAIVEAATSGVFFGQLIVAVLGVLLISGEYSTGQIRTTFTSVPGRISALVAKGLVLFVTAFGVSLLSFLAGWAMAAPIIGAGDSGQNAFDADLILPIVGGAFYLAIVAVFALGVGTILRNTAGSVATALALILLPPLLASIFYGSTWVSDVEKFSLLSAWTSMTTGIGTLTTVQSVITLVAWAVASLGIGAILLKRRDA